MQGSPMLTPALRYLTLRSLGAPAVLLSLAMQGVFRGFKDTKTPLYATGEYTPNYTACFCFHISSTILFKLHLFFFCFLFYITVAGDVTNIILDPILMFVFHLGISGAAIAHVFSQLSFISSFLPAS